MKKSIFFIILSFVLVSMSSVLSTDDNFIIDIEIPTAYSTSTSTSVIFNMSVNWSGSSIITTNVTNCSLWLKNSSTGTYLQNTTNIILTNTTPESGFVNATIILPDNKRYWSYWNCIYNATTELGNSSVVIIDVDTTYDTLTLGSDKLINFSLSTGLVTMTSLQLSPKTTETAVEGRIFYNSTSNLFMGYNASGWQVLG